MVASNLINGQSNHHAPIANGEDLCERPGPKDFWDKMVWHCDPELAESVRVPVRSLRRPNHGKIERQSTSCRTSAVLYGFGRYKSPDRVLHVVPNSTFCYPSKSQQRHKSIISKCSQIYFELQSLCQNAALLCAWDPITAKTCHLRGTERQSPILTVYHTNNRLQSFSPHHPLPCVSRFWSNRQLASPTCS
ncbi:uncharacterized protein K441DRAFT_372428 [Cenococcum geophilum 1.58]|uniref:uncharacterized protein n=1 Tax=Cenococcum geophilum 1.58 TaxID=794803 RepID=UPI00358E0217|nr:hypothetical protein K441DRAFT_372428 [Cenococcum geophilum 1.58]